MMKRSEKKMLTFELTAVQPEGWLKRQLEIQMNGLTGILYDVWDSVGSYSGWLGGTGENWERGPYYLDGLLPLSWYLKDEGHYKTAMRFIEWTLNSQDETGNFGPETSKHDYWSRFVILKVLIQYYEIEKDKRVLSLMGRYFRYLEKAMSKVPATLWARARIGDLLYCIQWYIEQTGDEEVCALTALLREHALDWADVFEDFPFVRPVAYYYDWKKLLAHYSKDQLDEVMKYHSNHVVNVGMGMKYPAMLSYFYDDRDYEAISLEGMRSTEKYHGVPSGTFNGDEHLSGNNPTQGSELCAVIEYMFSLQTMMERFGNPVFADQLERLAYNALPATIADDFMSHQYLQQANQVLVSRAQRNWFNNNEEANLFGLEPNFGCCTANMHQGWPKFVKSLWYLENDKIPVSMVFAPCTLCTDVDGKEVEIQLDTDYPFKNQIWYQLKKAENLKLKIRIPGWCEKFTVCKNGAEIECHSNNGFMELENLNSGDKILFVPEMPVRFTSWYKKSVAVERGPLVFGLDMKERWEAIREVAGIKDYEIYPESPWNYALDKHSEVRIDEPGSGDIPFGKQEPPVVITMSGKILEGWVLENDSAGEFPLSPVEGVEGEAERIRLIPFGCTKLRVSEFPWY